MEDIRIGRRSLSRELAFTTPAAGALQVLGGSPNRIAIVLGAPLAGVLTYSTNSNPTTGLGINVTVGQDPVVLSIQDAGEIVTHQFWVIGDAAARVGAVIETILGEA
jgi:hypothetical protein